MGVQGKAAPEAAQTFWLSEAEKQLLELLHMVGWGEVTIKVEKGQPKGIRYQADLLLSEVENRGGTLALIRTSSK